MWFLFACVPHIPEPSLAPPTPDAGAGLPQSVCWVEYAQGTLPHGTVVAHGALDADVPSTQSGLLVKHAAGTWLVDLGAAASLETDAKEVHGLDAFFLSQAMAGWTYLGPARSLVPEALDGAIATHEHFDHVGALLDLDVPVWVAPDERTWEGFGRIPASTRKMAQVGRSIPFEAKPLWYWPQSWDVFADGSLVVVPMPGHTPGSVGVRVRLPDGRAVFLVGDTVWVKEGYEARERKGWLASRFDRDADTLDGQISRLWALHRAEPALVILPSHDRRVWASVFGKPGCVAASPG